MVKKKTVKKAVKKTAREKKIEAIQTELAINFGDVHELLDKLFGTSIEEAKGKKFNSKLLLEELDDCVNNVCWASLYSTNHPFRKQWFDLEKKGKIMIRHIMVGGKGKIKVVNDEERARLMEKGGWCPIESVIWKVDDKKC